MYQGFHVHRKRDGGTRTSAWIWPVVLVLLLPAALQGADAAREARIKAAIVFKLIKFVQWPKDRFDERNPDLILCVAGGGPVADALRGASGRSVGGREVVYRDAVPLRDMRRCDVLYLSDTGYFDLGEIFTATKGSGALLVSDEQDFARRGGAVGLVISDNRVRFRINLRAVREEGLVIPAPVLQLAELVDGGEAPRR